MMKTRLILSAALALGLVAASNADVGIIDSAPLYKEVWSTNSTIEIVHPYFKEVFPTTGGDYIRFNFDVYGYDSSVKLNSTPAKIVFYPQPICDASAWFDYFYNSGDFKFLGKVGPRSHVGLGLRTTCQEQSTGQQKDSYKTFIYSANVSNDASAGQAWTKVYNLKMLAFDEIDVDGDLINELVLTMTADVTGLTSPDAVNTRTIVLNKLDGSVLVDKQRALLR